jgi:succinate dehydrogenase / fumarate reductase iron-sulfur subunit
MSYDLYILLFSRLLGQPPALHKEPLTFEYVPLSKELQVAMNLTLRIWRQQSADAPGKFVNYQVKDVTPDMSFLETLDALNEDLLDRDEAPVAFEHDCREGICGSCGFLINGVAQGGQRGTTVCQLAMRFFRDGDALTLEPWRARAFPVIRDLIVNRSAFDRIIQTGGFISAPTGSAPDANVVLVSKEAADTAFDAAACIGCGACVAACPNAAAMLSPPPKSPISTRFRRVSPSATRGLSAWWSRWQTNTSAVARIMASVRRYALSRYPSSSSG